MLLARMDHKGRVVLPLEVRVAMRLRAGDEVLFEPSWPAEPSRPRAFRVEKVVLTRT